jgi:hypothetical protein
MCLNCFNCYLNEYRYLFLIDSGMWDVGYSTSTKYLSDLIFVKSSLFSIHKTTSNIKGMINK